MRSMKIIPMIAAVLMLVSCNRDPSVAKQRYLESGNKYFERGKYKEARIFYKDSIQKDPRFGPAYYKLGLTAMKIAETNGSAVNEAVQAFRRAVELLKPEDPDHWNAAVKLAEIYLLAGANQKEFMSEVDKTVAGLLERDPNSWDGYRLRGDVNFKRAVEAAASPEKSEAVKLLDAAIEDYRKADSIKPDQPGVLLQLARCIGSKGQLPEAETLYRKVIEIDHGNRRAYVELYRLLVVARNYPAAEQVLKSGFQTDPKDYNLLVLLALHYSALQQRDSMVATLQQIKSHFKDYPDAYQKVGDFYLQIGDGDSAIREYREGIGQDPSRKLVYQKRIIETLMRQGKRSEAADLNSQILKESPTDTDAKGLAATFLLDKGDIAQALADLQGVVTRAPDNPVARFNLGRAYVARGEFELGRQAFRKAIEIRPDYVGARLALAQLEVLRGEFVAAFKDAGDVLALDRNNQNATLLQATALMGQRKFAESRALVENVLKVNAASADAYYLLGIQGLAEKKYKEAEAAFQKVTQLSPANMRGLLGQVETQLQQEHPDAALKILQDESAKSPGRTDLVLTLGNVSARAGRFDQAIGYYQQVLGKLDPNARARSDIYLRMGEAQRRKGDYSGAIASLQKAKEIQPENMTTLVTMGIVLDTNLNRWAEAKTVYEAILKVEPQNGVALNNLAFIIAEHGGDLDDALTKATRAKQAMPELPEVSDTLGWIYLKKNLPDAALDVFKALVQKVPNSSTFRYHLGMALNMKGDKPKAIKELQEALKYNPSKEERDAIQQMLNRLNAS